MRGTAPFLIIRARPLTYEYSFHPEELFASKDSHDMPPFCMSILPAFVTAEATCSSSSGPHRLPQRRTRSLTPLSRIMRTG